MKKKWIHPTDRLVGARLQLARVGRKMSQTELAAVGGITFQQVQKYEKGTNRVSASRLFEFANALGVEVSYFFDGATSQPSERKPVKEKSSAVDPIDAELLSCLQEMNDAKLKHDLLKLLRDRQSPLSADYRPATRQRPSLLANGARAKSSEQQRSSRRSQR